MLTLEQFRASRRRVDNLSAVTLGEHYDSNGVVVKKAGYVYVNGLVIEIEDDGRLFLQLYRDDELADGTAENLARQKAKLYEWAVREGYLETLS